jgi:hypothetical protein
MDPASPRNWVRSLANHRSELALIPFKAKGLYSLFRLGSFALSGSPHPVCDGSGPAQTSLAIPLQMRSGSGNGPRNTRTARKGKGRWLRTVNAESTESPAKIHQSASPNPGRCPSAADHPPGLFLFFRIFRVFRGSSLRSRIVKEHRGTERIDRIPLPYSTITRGRSFVPGRIGDRAREGKSACGSHRENVPRIRLDCDRGMEGRRHFRANPPRRTTSRTVREVEKPGTDGYDFPGVAGARPRSHLEAPTRNPLEA